VSATVGVGQRRVRGQALVEFALIVPLLLLIVIGLFDLGRAVFAYNAISNAAREGGRTAIVNQHKPDIIARAAAQATSLGVSTSAACTGDVPSGPSGVCTTFVLPSDMSTDCSSTLAPGCVAIVNVKYTFTPITPIIGNIVGSITMNATTQQIIESVCTASGCPIP
jgi:Flp pilus assembly protein TadG